jgi:hypothetical protein
VTTTDERIAGSGVVPVRRRRELPSAPLGLIGLLFFAGLLELLPRPGTVSEDEFGDPAGRAAR